MHEKRFQRATTLALVFAMLFSLLPMAVPKAGAASTSTLANVTESYVDASDGMQISKDETYSVTHKERTPQKIADYTYQDYRESVERVYSHKDISYIYGYPDKTVRPDQPMTRSEAAAVFYRLYDGQYPSVTRTMSPETFSDLSTDLWCYKEIELLYSIGSIDGYGDGTFRPNAPVTRAEFAALAARWAGLDRSNDAKFSDVTTNHWAYGEINAAAAAGWVDGYPDGTFQPDQDIARVEVMKLVNRMVNRSITTEELEKLGAVNPYTDLVDTHWGYPQVKIYPRKWTQNLCAGGDVPKRQTEKNVHPANGMVKYNEMEGCKMGRTRRKFTEEEIKILAKNPYTYRVTDTTIRFTLAFKEEFLKRYKEGLSPKQIVTDLGYRVEILGVRRVEGLRDHIVKESLSEAGLHEGTLHAKIKPASRDYTTLPASKAIEYMQHELLYLRQEVEFLKKIIAADNTGKRKK